MTAEDQTAIANLDELVKRFGLDGPMASPGHKARQHFACVGAALGWILWRFVAREETVLVQMMVPLLLPQRAIEDQQGDAVFHLRAQNLQPEVRITENLVLGREFVQGEAAFPGAIAATVVATLLQNWGDDFPVLVQGVGF